MSRFKAAALRYARAGMAVFPCQVKGKKPLTRNGVKDATTDEEIIAAWWAEWPDANVAIAMGAESGVWALDVDLDKGGQASLAALTERIGLLPVTPTQRTGAGLHFLFRWTADAPGNTASKLGEGLDTRGEGGYIIAAPSIHPNGRAYEWIKGDGPPPKPAPAPDALLELLRKPKPRPHPEAAPRQEAPPRPPTDAYARAAMEGEYRAVASAGEGSRNHALNAAAFSLGQLAADGLVTAAAVEAALLAASAENGQLAEDGEPAILAVIRSGFEAGLAHPRERKEPPRGFNPRVVVGGAGGSSGGGGGGRRGGGAQPEEEPSDDPDVHPETEAFILDAKGNVKSKSLRNAIIALQTDAGLAGLFVQNDFTGEVFVTRRPPWTLNGFTRGLLTDDAVTGCAYYLEAKGLIVGLATMHAAINFVASENHINPVADALRSYQWDAKPRLDHWLCDYLGAPETAFIRTVAAKWLIGSVARILRPGSKVDTMLILEGPQGLKKSTALEALATFDGHPYFADKMPALGSKDACLELQGKIVVEIAELDALHKAEISQVKAFLTQRIDRFRPPYGRNVIERPRTCVFAGTVNPGASGYLNDPTGGRRFWPVPVAKVDLDDLRDTASQLWAEAVVRYHAGETWWLEDDAVLAEAREQQRDRFEVDAWAAKIDPYIYGKAKVRIADILGPDCLCVDTAQQDIAKQRRVGSHLRFRGWEKKQMRDPTRDNAPVWFFMPPGAEAEDGGDGA